MNHLADFHVHPDYSIDATGTIRQYCDRALDIGIKLICFTTHYDANPRRVELDGYWNHNNSRVRFSDELVRFYFDELEEARTFFADFGLRVYRGLEIDYFPGVEDEIERLRREFPLDFLIGSVHCLDDIAISEKREAQAYFTTHSISQLADDYFRLLQMAAACPGFDSLGHLDYYIRYCRDYYGHDVDQIEIERYDSVFDILKKGNRGFEINTSPYRYGIEGFHPHKDIIKRAIQADVKIASVGSDSHKPAKLGLGLNKAYEFLNQLRVTPEFPRAR
jgi:histidinol-phosphatase (PHP family)